jgi:hypothetical protein
MPLSKQVRRHCWQPRTVLAGQAGSVPHESPNADSHTHANYTWAYSEIMARKNKDKDNAGTKPPKRRER